MTTPNTKLLIAQPIIASYRVPMFNKLAKVFDTTIVADPLPNDAGYYDTRTLGTTEITSKTYYFLNRKISFQTKILSQIIRLKPRYIFITCYTRNITFWLVLFISRVSRSKVIIHGQGLYRNTDRSYPKKFSTFLVLSLCWAYACYTPLSLQTMNKFTNKFRKKLFVADNMLVNKHPVTYDQKTLTEHRILFIGRLRQGSKLDLLIEAIEKLNKNRTKKVVIDVIGTGPEEQALRRKYAHLNQICWYGAIYDERKIAMISKSSTAACYPGDAGLSIVHFLSLSLPVIVHSDFTAHMGPEPSYIKDEYNGKLYSPGDVDSLKSAVAWVLDLPPEQYSSVCRNSFTSYTQLLIPDMADKIISYINSRNKTFNPK